MKYYEVKEKPTNLSLNDQLKADLSPLQEDVRRMQSIQSSLALSGVKNEFKDEGNEGNGVFSDFDLILAVQDIFDMQARSNTQFIILGHLARAIKDRQERITLPESKNGYKGLEWGIREKQLTPEIKGLFKTWGFDEQEYGYSYTFSPPTKWDIKIPVKVRIITKHYPFFEALDTGFFGADGFYIPNPFENYWKKG